MLPWVYHSRVPVPIPHHRNFGKPDHVLSGRRFPALAEGARKYIVKGELLGPSGRHEKPENDQSLLEEVALVT